LEAVSSGQYFSKKNPQDIPYEELIGSIEYNPQLSEDQISVSILGLSNEIGSTGNYL
jgi:hypothetical protein